jgi:hypothetical protein
MSNASALEPFIGANHRMGGALRWGGQGSNLRPEDYESPALTD